MYDIIFNRTICIHTYMCTPICKHIYTYVYTHICVYTYVYLRINENNLKLMRKFSDIKKCNCDPMSDENK